MSFFPLRISVKPCSYIPITYVKAYWPGRTQSSRRFPLRVII